MVCENCGATVGADDAFCTKCGTPTGRGRPTRPSMLPPPALDSRADQAVTPDLGELADPVGPPIADAPSTGSDDATGAALAAPTARSPVAAPDAPDDTDITTDLPVDPFAAPSMGTTDAPVDPFAAPTTGTTDAPVDPFAAATTGTTDMPAPVDPFAAPTAVTTDMPAPVADESVAPTTTVETLPPPGTVTSEVPRIFDGQGDLQDYPPPREGFRIRLVFIFALFSGIAAVLAPAAQMIDVRTTRPVDGITTGAVSLDDVGSNLAVAGYVGIGAMVIGGVIACWSFRWAAGLAGGGALAIIGWAALVIGLLEARISSAEQVTRSSPVGFTLEITRDLGYWLIVAAAGLAAITFLASLRLSGTAGRPGLNPWIAAVGAVFALVLATGPLLPVGDAAFADNFRSTDASGDLPALYFAGRITQVTLIGVAGAIGFLLVRRWGLGLVAGTISIGTWMWYSSMAELGDNPLGIAAGNFGANDTTPHAVTTVGMVGTLVMLLAAIVDAMLQASRRRRRR